MASAVDFIDLKSQYAALKPSVDARIQAVLDHGQYIMGPEVEEMEAKLSAYVGGAECISVSSGTEALLIALMALGIGPSDEVITSPFTFAATAEVIALVGATPVFVDIEPDTCNINVSLVEAAITSRTRAIMPVSLYGQTADMQELNDIADRHGLAVIEDAAQSFGATYHDAKSCNVSRIGCTSFFPSKPLGCYGDGGAIFASDPELTTVMRQIRVHGQGKRYHHVRVGVGGRMDTIQAAVILAKLEQFEWEVERRIAIGQRYIDRLAGMNSIQLPVVRPDRSCVWAQFTIQTADRDALIAALKAQGIPTAIHYPVPLHMQPAYGPISRISGTLNNAEAVSQRVLSLPMHPYLTEETQDRIIAALPV
ncbi:UDP-2-acetamido-2-deoxy-ribo-hexuluronate aminotransferase [Devosia lucknowensis]|uniref:UDP-2-acetamido-2-deoxy-ribo-hexuluronate aminotransferase n=1 Tax=Devosia lucknowensis TaxID=1096929 RepID=A0A1Y6G629_9HYPH|nr:DegT/DnrJ/EryC1/StrS family aminotransferase [Devosia lucknowensis]SMQ85536.1 UDP-2-acetamido-2-deoxy-ribo-hexuluronate aminotransferase [Devosia lucknowensis]